LRTGHHPLQHVALLFLSERQENSLRGFGLGIDVGNVVNLCFDEEECGRKLRAESIDELIRGLVDNGKSVRWG
jgi:hypothetical protein